MKRRDPQPPKALQEPPHRLPATIEPMMLTHLVLSGDADQYAEWREQIERVRQVDAVDRAPDPETKSLLASRPAWRQMRETGLLGSVVSMSVASLWMSWLFKAYAVILGFGWLAASAFLLPIPLAWFIGRRLWENAAVQGMKDHMGAMTPRKRVRGFAMALVRSFGAGFGFGFTLMFLQALITWFMTPADTLFLELMYDLYDGIVMGTMTGVMGTMLAPLVGRPAPEENAGLPPPALPAPLDD